ncbi:MAG: tRNA lysidine(34) synthetase TilS [Nitrospirae bacterium]|nr:tRNA lysidine(34) synthetase TilS [Nitrospirota bacterium]
MELLKKIKETINKYSMLTEGDRILIGLSGGPDSVCLAIILHEFIADFNLTLNAVYVDHGLRPDEVENEKTFCREFCEKLGLGFYTRYIDVIQYADKNNLNRQEAARELRYQAYNEVSKETGAAKIALGHTADDQIETFFMRLLRGAGPAGLTGIPPIRSGSGVRPACRTGRGQGSGVQGSTLIIRPLIGIERKHIEEFLASDSSPITCRASRPFMVDSSNLKSDYLRNWIRSSVITGLKKRNPSLVQNICRTTDIMREEERYFEIIVTKTLMKLVSGKTDSRINLFLAPLEAMNKVILRRVLRRAVEVTKGLRGMQFIHIEGIINLIKHGKPGDRIYLPKGLRVIKNYSTLVMTTDIPKSLGCYAVSMPGEVVLGESGYVLKAFLAEKIEDRGDGKTTAILDADKLRNTLHLRATKNGDFFYPLGFGRRKKLQDFFVIQV